MKKIFAAIWVAISVTGASYAQISTPAPSPSSSLTQEVGLTQLQLDYSRPSARGRVVFGELLPYGILWRTGANSPTTLSFDRPAIINGKELAPGTYTITSVPGKTEWTVSFSQNDQSLVDLKVKPVAYPAYVETLTLGFDKITDTSAEFQILWEKTLIAIPMTFKTDEQVMAQIESFAKDPEASLANAYYQAASYYLSTNRDLNQALEWVDKAIAVNGGFFWQHRTRALILAGLGKYKEAIAAAQVSTEKSKAAGNADYPRLNSKSIAEWQGKK